MNRRICSVDIEDHAQPKDNLMYIIFPSAFRRGRRLEAAALGRDKHWPCWNGDPSRVFVRKAGYNYGWDWGPTLMTGACADRVLTNAADWGNLSSRTFPTRSH